MTPVPHRKEIGGPRHHACLCRVCVCVCMCVGVVLPLIIVCRSSESQEHHATSQSASQPIGPVSQTTAKQSFLLSRSPRTNVPVTCALGMARMVCSVKVLM